jgi:hypothetical protein
VEKKRDSHKNQGRIKSLGDEEDLANEKLADNDKTLSSATYGARASTSLVKRKNKPLRSL